LGRTKNPLGVDFALSQNDPTQTVNVCPWFAAPKVTQYREPHDDEHRIRFLPGLSDQRPQARTAHDLEGTSRADPVSSRRMR
jgi:hypothetical protein